MAWMILSAAHSVMFQSNGVNVGTDDHELGHNRAK
jgi:hypothetical protein